MALRPTGDVFFVVGLVVGLVAGALACGGGATKGQAGSGGAGATPTGPFGGAGGAAGAGAGGPGGAAGAAGTTGASAATVGDLIPADADIYCLRVASPNEVLGLGYERMCTSGKRLSGPPVTAADADTFCSQWGDGGTRVAACPVTDPAVAYCSWTIGDPGTLMLEVFRVIERGTATPDAAAVVRNAEASCGTAAVYDASHRRVTTVCTGTFSALVNDVRTTFLNEHTCRFVTDGTRSVWGLNTTLFAPFQPPSAIPSLQMELHKGETGVSFGIFTFGAIGITYVDSISLTAPLDQPSVSYRSEVFAEDGTAIKGAFNVGLLASSSGQRLITEGIIDLKFEVQ